MSDRDLRLNSVSRYAKESSRLILEEHGHCEIPAGCGGVVLRWFNPARALPLEFWIFIDGDVDFALDGEATTFARPMVEYGEHVLSFAIRNFPVKTGIFMFAAISEIRNQDPGAVQDKSASKKVVLSDGDGSWKYTVKAPSGELWMKAGFDDREWETLVLKPVAQPANTDIKYYRHGKLRELGANGLGIDVGGNWISKLLAPTPSPSEIWVRKVFRLTPAADK